MLETSLSNNVLTRKIVRQRWSFPLALSKRSLLIILAFQTVVSLFTLRNTAFQDEALYIYAGRQILARWAGGPPVLDPYSLYFSGYPYFYPVIAGVLDIVGGLELVRLFSLLCMLGVTTCVYYLTKNIFNYSSAIFASALYVCMAAVLFIGRLATYDALCLFFFSLAAVLAYRVSGSRRSWSALAIGPLLILAVVAKYAALLFVPSILGILIVCCLQKQGWLKLLKCLLLMAFSSVIVALIFYLTLDKSVLAGLSLTTTNRVVLLQQSTQQLLSHIIEYAGPAYLLGFIGLFLTRKKNVLLGLLLVGSSLLAPAYHIYKHEFVSLDKHLAFGMFFIIPLAGYTLSFLSGYYQQRLEYRRAIQSGLLPDQHPGESGMIGRYWLSGLALCIVLFSIGSQQARSIYAAWPSTGDLSYVYHTQLRPQTGRYLAEDIEVSRYDTEDVSQSWQWNNSSFFDYTDKTGHYSAGNPAYSAALHDGYFDVVELSFQYNPGQAYTIYHYLLVSKKYDLVAKVFYTNAYGSGYFWIWHRHSPTKVVS